MALPHVLVHWFESQHAMFLHSPLSLSLPLFLSVFLLVWNYRTTKASKSFKLPPSPFKLPIIGHLHLLGKFPHRSLHALSQKHGPIMQLKLGSTPTLVVSSAEIAKQIMKTQDLIFADRPTTSASKAFVDGNKDIGFAPYGDYWRYIRKIFVTDLLTLKRRESFKLVREEEIGNLVSKIKQSCSLGGDITINVSDSVLKVIQSFVPRIALGKHWGKSGKYGDLPRQVSELYGIISFEDVFPSLGWIDVLTGLRGKLKKVSKGMTQFLDEVIDEHMLSRNAEEDARDFVDTLLDHKTDPTSGIELTRECLRAVLLDMFVGGTDMLNTSFEWAIAEIFNHPKVLEELQTEVRRVVGTNSKVDENDISHMHYLHCVVKESLRLHPPSTLIIPRVSTSATTVEGYHVPARTLVYINAWAIARDPKHWDRADEFIPERFIGNEADFRGKDFDFIPFGAGRRICPAISFATISIESIIANLLYWFDWKLPSDVNDMSLDMSEAVGATSHKKYPVCLVPTSHIF